MNKNAFFLFFVIIFSNVISAQKPFSWNDLVDWNGVNGWNQYFIMSPGYMGPNALPVPEAEDGLIEPGIKFKTALDFHFMKGDQTQDLYLQFSHPFCNNMISVGFSAVPAEHYQLDTTIRDERLVRFANPHGFAGGDIIFWTNIQLIKNRPGWPDVLFNMACRTASGGDLQDARYTDMPGYYFDLSFGKSFLQNKEKNSWLRWYLMLGFYCWQTNLTAYSQNDAGLFGGGLKLNLNDILINNSISGYIGYIGMKHIIMIPDSSKPHEYAKDQPVVYRLDISKVSGKYEYGFRFQQGLHDFKYSTFRVSLSYFFNDHKDSVLKAV
ncbi:MAG: hypothetical protein NTW49_10740 [Bacteroidia bacterium]|nr:hypothetical protein [Bacteroidia bacterium]